MPGDDVAEEMLVVLREINAKRRRIGAKDVGARPRTTCALPRLADRTARNPPRQ